MSSETNRILSPAVPEKTSRAALFVGAGQPLQQVTLPVPEVAAGEALVRITCCTICGSDLHTIGGKRREPEPAILGHEIVGTVAEIGSPAPQDLTGEPLRPGDRVTWSTSISCGHCDRCRGGLPQKCRTLAKYGHEQAVGRYALSGGLAEYLLLRSGSSVVRLPASLPVEVACPANCATATVVAALRVAQPVPEQRVLILGAGMLGLTAAAYAAVQRAAQVVVCDPLPARLARAAEFGATHTLVWEDDLSRWQANLARVAGAAEFDIVLELSGAVAAAEAACACGAIGARIVLVGAVLPSRPMQLFPERIVRQWLTIRGVHNYGPADLATAVQFLDQYHHRFPFASLVERSFPLTEVQAAIELAQRDRPVRVAVLPAKEP